MSNMGIRILITKPGLDGHDRGAKVVALALRNAGFEVIYSGLHQSVDQIVETAIQEDVDVIGLSILSGAHLPITQKLMTKLKKVNLSDKLVLVGGNIPAQDSDTLIELGVDAIFPTGSHFDEIVAFIRENVGKKEKIQEGTK